MKKEYRLQPFDDKSASDKFELLTALRKTSGILAVAYKLVGPINELSFQSSSGKPERKNGLWEETCFELFIMPCGSEAYWEINLSPSGDWNIYRFNGYRRGMQEEQGFKKLPFNVKTLTDCLMLDIEIDLKKFIKSQSAINVGVNAVIKNGDNKTYWALAHKGGQPDFHRKDGFTIKLQG
jgi:hypothetical protein